MSSSKLEIIKTVVWGASGHASAVANALGLQRTFEVLGFIDDVNPDRLGNIFCGNIILGGKEQLPSIRLQNIKHFALGFGNCSARINLGNFLIKEGFQLVNVYHPKATIANSTEIGRGTVVLAGAVVDPDCQISDYCIINNNSTISHNSIIGKGVHVCPGVHVAGKVKIGSGSWIGIGSCVTDKVSIGTRTYVGAGSVVINDIPDGVLAYGNPARVIRSTNESF